MPVGNWGKLIIRLLFAALGGALVLWFGAWWYQQPGPGTAAPTLVLTGEQLKLVAGEGGRTKDGILILRPPPGKPAMVMAAPPPIGGWAIFPILLGYQGP